MGIKTLLVGLSLQSAPRIIVEDYLDELAELVSSAGGTVVQRTVQERAKPEPSTFIGKGKAEEVASFCRENGIRLVVFDDDLSPAQVRNLEKILEIKVTDRTGIILDIFAKRARTREARTQVELAQYTYLLPRLTRAWTHLSRQAGGIGTRGVGETQLETDRRVIRRRIQALTKELTQIAKRREVQSRRRRNTFEIALVGYTNVGKSSLLNRLTAARVRTADRLFATLDTTFRKLHLDGLRDEVLLIDTVGLIRKLPHHLVASFRTTLEQASEADLLLHVVDISHPTFEEQAYTTLKVLSELEMDDIPLITVLNKIDRAQEGVMSRGSGLYPESVPVSATTGSGIEHLKEVITGHIHKVMAGTRIRVPYEKWPDFLPMRGRVRVLREEYEEDGIRLTLQGRRHDLEAIERLLHTDSSGQKPPEAE